MVPSMQKIMKFPSFLERSMTKTMDKFAKFSLFLFIKCSILHTAQLYFVPNITFIYPLKLLENLCFSDFFRGYRNVISRTNGLWKF